MPYFAYCTLLEEAEMQRFVPSARIGAVGSVSGQRVVFATHRSDLETGGCNLFSLPGHTIYGVLYDLTDDEFAQLDAISGVDNGLYQRTSVQVTTDVGDVDAETYIIPQPGGAFRPTAAYTRPILAGARALGLPEEYIAELDALVSDRTMSGKRIVEDGYDILAETYLNSRRMDSADVRLLDELTDRLPDGARVLDAGCGAGVPIAKALSDRFQVTGVDLSAAQIQLARETVPGVSFIQADMTALDLPDASFDAIVSYYAIIHIPREEHAELFTNFRRMLAPSGLLLVSMGAGDNPDDTEEDWLGGGATMYWSHYGHADNLRLISEAGFDIIWDRLVIEEEAFGGGTHLFVLAQRRAA